MAKKNKNGQPAKPKQRQKKLMENIELTPIRNQAARALINKHPAGEINWYLMQLLDPKCWEEAVNEGWRGIPDTYSHRNHLFCTRTLLDVDSAAFDSTGRARFEIHPSLRQHILSSTPATAAVSYAVVGYEAVGGAGKLTTSDLAHSYKIGSTSFTNTSPLPLYTDGHLHCRAPETSVCKRLEGISFNKVDADFGDYRYNVTAGANVLSTSVQLAAATDGVRTFTFSAETSFGTETVVSTPLAGVTTFQQVLTLNVATTYIASLRLTPSTSIAIKSVDVNASLQSPGDSSSLISSTVTGFDSFEGQFSAYRCVAGYAWYKYRGDLTKNGNCAGALIDTKSSPAADSLVTYEGVAGLLHAHEGTVTQGIYGIWCPMDNSDLEFHSLDDLPDGPYLNYALDVSDVDAQKGRLECYFVWEGLTQKTIYNPMPSTVNIYALNDAFEKLAHFDKVMANDSHFTAIKDFLSGAYKKGSALFKAVVADPVGKAGVLKVAKMLAEKASTYGPAVAAAARQLMVAFESVI